MKHLALVFVIACGSQTSAPPPKTEPLPSVASVATASVSPPAPQPTSKAFHVVRENVQASSQMIARIGDREAGAMTAPSVGYPDSVCFVATGISSDMGAKCHAIVESGHATVEVEFEDDTMQSRSRTHVVMRGTLTVAPDTQAIIGASFTGLEQFQFRPPCEKNAGCEHCDPLVRTTSCKPICYCPFTSVGKAEIETRYGP
jgi:hypothetical protein